MMNANVWGVILLMSTMTVWVPSDASTTTCEDALTTLLAEYTGDTECMTTLNAFFSESTSDACTNANKTAIGTCMNKHEDAWDTFETDCDDVLSVFVSISTSSDSEETSGPEEAPGSLSSRGSNPFLSPVEFDPSTSPPAVPAPEEMPDLDDLEDTFQTVAMSSTRRRLMGVDTDGIHDAVKHRRMMPGWIHDVLGRGLLQSEDSCADLYSNEGRDPFLQAAQNGAATTQASLTLVGIGLLGMMLV